MALLGGPSWDGVDGGIAVAGENPTQQAQAEPCIGARTNYRLGDQRWAGSVSVQERAATEVLLVLHERQTQSSDLCVGASCAN